MAQMITTITDKQSGKTQFPDRKIIPKPVPNIPAAQNIKSSSAAAAHPQPKYQLINKDGQIVATLIDKALAEKWVAEHKRGASRCIEDAASTSA